MTPGLYRLSALRTELLSSCSVNFRGHQVQKSLLALYMFFVCLPSFVCILFCRFPGRVLKPEDFEAAERASQGGRGGRGGGRGGFGRGGYRPQLGFTPDSHYRGGHRDMGPANRTIRFGNSSMY